ncbi:hypothetical protein FGO68_gene7127 [Halteria grandinella]|uniref:Uncharacterized protein n=1 Tax=Halteria grandinella TaxID=5974 RepID=A0A8J8NJ77_HALGN|nr:hypothetical protein FGO68_gene7127 [Halteria grandinella]
MEDTPMDNCGYSADDYSEVTRVDTRNSKYQAKMNHTLGAASNKSYNFKQYQKMLMRRGAQQERDELRAQQVRQIKQITVENKKWAPVDSEDAKHMQKEAAKRQKEMAKLEKKREREELVQREEEKVQKESEKMSMKMGTRSWAKKKNQGEDYQ